MLRHFFVICFLVLGWITDARADAVRPRVACLPVAAKTIDAMAYNEQISSKLVSALDRSGAVELVERKKIEAVIEQHGLRLDATDQELLKGLGGEAGFNFIVTGSVGRSEGKLLIEINLIGTSSPKDNHHWSYKIGDGEISSKIDEITAAIVPIMKAFEKSEESGAPVSAPAELSAPKELQGAGSARSIRLKWEQPGAELVSGYRVFRSTSAEGSYSEVGNSTVNSFTDENLELNDSFYYKVKALGKGGGESGFSDPVQARTITVPLPPVFMGVEAGIRSAALSWYQRPVAGGDDKLVPVKYRVYRSASDKNEYQQVAELKSGATAYSDAALSENSSYRYYVTSVNAAGGESEQSAVLQVTTQGGMAGLSAVSGNIRKIPLSWKPHASPNVAGYNVYRASAKDGPFQKIAETKSREATSYVDAVDSDNALRWYRITGVDKDGNETMPGEAASATTKAAPGAPAALQARSGLPRRVTLSWQSSNGDDEKGGYCIYRSDEERGKFKRIGKVAEKVIQFEDGPEPLEDNTPYWYRITAVNAAGIEGTPSEAAKAVTKAKPSAPRHFAATSGEVRKVTLSWEQNQEKDITEYRVWLRAPSGKFTLVTATKTPSHVATGLADGTVFAYAVSAVDADGLESPVSVAEARTQRAPAKASEARAIYRNGQAGIAWEKNPESNIRTYCVYKKGFMGAQKLCETKEPEYLHQGKEKVELYVTAVNNDGLEGEPSATITIDGSKDQ